MNYNNDVINHILNDKKINAAIKSICNKYIGPDYLKDFIQYIYEVYINLSNTKLLELYNNDKSELGAYCVTIALNHSSKRSNFYKEYLNYGRAGTTPTYYTNILDNITADTQPDIEQELKDNHTINTIYNIIKKLKGKDVNGYYDATLFEEHILNGKTYRQLSKETKISHTSIRLAVERTKKYIKKELKKYNL